MGLAFTLYRISKLSCRYKNHSGWALCSHYTGSVGFLAVIKTIAGGPCVYTILDQVSFLAVIKTIADGPCTGSVSFLVVMKTIADGPCVHTIPDQ